jgi:two-component system, oxyanion-binding sensor
VLRTIEGRLVLREGGPQVDLPDFIRYDVPGAVRPHAGRYAWLYAQMVRWGQTKLDPAAARQIEALIRTDLYDRATGSPPGPAPAGDPVGSLIGPPFDAADMAGYLGRFDARGMPKNGR